jgi:hypothetical protein
VLAVSLEQTGVLPTFIEGDELPVRMLTSGYLSVLPDIADRVLLCDA